MVSETGKVFASKALAYIEAHPEQHDQSYWIMGDEPGHCGTTMCLAGTISWLANGDVSITNTEYEAQEILGISREEAEIIFYEMNEDRAKAKLAKIARGEMLDEEDFYTVTNKDDYGRDGTLEFQGYWWARYKEKQEAIA